MGSAFHQLCPRYSGNLTPTAPTAIRLWETFTFTCKMKKKKKITNMKTKIIIVTNTLYRIISDMTVSICFIFCGFLLCVCRIVAIERVTQIKHDINVSQTKGKEKYFILVSLFLFITG